MPQPLRVEYAMLLVLSLACSCHRKSGENIQTGPSQSVKNYTEAELNKLIVSGMSATEVTNRFGPSASATEMGKGVILLMYSFPIDWQKEGLHLAGFSISVKEGNVTGWSRIMEESRNSLKAGASRGEFGEQSFQIFLVTDSLTNMAKTVERQGSADASSLKAAPDLALTAKIFTGSTDGENSAEQTVILVVTELNASKLKDLSEDNLGKQLLIVCRNKAIAAPTISAPLASRQLMFKVKNSEVLSVMSSQ